MESTLRRGAGDTDLRLIETLGWDGAAFVRHDLHLDRLARSAAQLGWACGPGLVASALRDAVGTVPARVRLTLDVAGRIEISVSAMPDGAVLWQIGLATEALQSTDPWLGVKSTRRAAYDTARASLPMGLDEVIFQNERGEVCDGTITTVFFDAGDGICTPPLSSGLLPGVLRAELLATGAARTAVLRAADLGRVHLMVGNSLRGLIPARFVD